jgi:hypothetical protein
MSVIQKHTEKWVIPGGKGGQGVALTTHLHFVGVRMTTDASFHASAEV